MKHLIYANISKDMGRQTWDTTKKLWYISWAGGTFYEDNSLYINKGAFKYNPCNRRRFFDITGLTVHSWSELTGNLYAPDGNKIVKSKLLRQGSTIMFIYDKDFDMLVPLGYGQVDTADYTYTTKAPNVPKGGLDFWRSHKVRFSNMINNPKVQELIDMCGAISKLKQITCSKDEQKYFISKVMHQEDYVSDTAGILNSIIKSATEHNEVLDRDKEKIIAQEGGRMLPAFISGEGFRRLIELKTADIEVVPYFRRNNA